MTTDPPNPTKVILRSGLSPGDILTLTAAVESLHATHPGEYLTDVRTPCPEIWLHDPRITAIQRLPFLCIHASSF